MTDRPIIMSAPMVRATLDDLKTMTRRLAWRVVKLRHPSPVAPTPPGLKFGERERASPWQRVRPGDRLWVRETWKPHSLYAHMKPREMPRSKVFYAADNAYAPSNTPWRPGIHMPRWASRLTLTVTAVRVERLQAITAEDAIAEGLRKLTKDGGQTRKYGVADRDGLPGEDDSGWPWHAWRISPVDAFEALWCRLHGAGAWNANPEVVAITFTVAKTNIDKLAA